MSPKEYQQWVEDTARCPDNDLTYPAETIASEGGEVLKEILRVQRITRCLSVTPEQVDHYGLRETLILEGGDVLWGLARMFNLLGVTFEEVMDRNKAKLQPKLDDGTLFQ